jgi:hypothetical protein
LNHPEEVAHDELQKQIAGLCYAYRLKPNFSGGRRGATVKVILPSGKSNSPNGEGWCVPNS